MPSTRLEAWIPSGCSSPTAQRAGVAKLRCHDLRHTAATHLARMGASEQLKAIGGWKSDVVSRSVHLAAEHARELLERMINKILGTNAKYVSRA